MIDDKAMDSAKGIKIRDTNTPLTRRTGGNCRHAASRLRDDAGKRHGRCPAGRRIHRL